MQVPSEHVQQVPKAKFIAEEEPSAVSLPPFQQAQSTPAISAVTADDKATVVAELKMAAGFKGGCKSEGVDWVQERVSRLVVSDLDYAGHKAKVKSALWTCEVREHVDSRGAAAAASSLGIEV